jgi:methionyl-tRNA formyltransferase
MSEIKAIVLCSNRFALPALQELAFFNQLAVVAVPRHCTDMAEDAQAVLNGSGIPVVQVDKASLVRQLTEAIQQHKANIGLVITFSYKIPASVYGLTEKGFFNVHPSPLPLYRGADPVFQQLKNREELAGVSLHQLDDGMDTGPVVARELIRIEEGDTYGMLTTKLSFTALNLIRTVLKLAAFGSLIPSRPQDEVRATYYPKQQAKDITINWKEMDAATIVALVRACNPWNKVAVTKINNKVVRLLEAERIEEKMKGGEPGTVLWFDATAMIVATAGEEAIRVTVVYTDEGFFSAALLQKAGLRAGSRFGEVY